MNKDNTVIANPSNSDGFKNPFKGASSYVEGDEKIFFGRDDDINKTIRSIIQNTLTLLYSRSGIGKTSLIKAGIMPKLNSVDTAFFPVYIRISDSILDKESENFSSAVIKLIEKQKPDNVTIKHKYALSNNPTLTEYIYLSEFIKKSNEDEIPEMAIPVLIFDQFEEIFSLNFDDPEKIKGLLIDLSNIIENKIPDNIKTDLGSDLHSFKNKLIQKDKWYRILFSFREEYLSQFESLKDAIPSIFYSQGRFHLETFPLSTATEVILKTSNESIKLDEEIANKLAQMLNRTDNLSTKFKDDVKPFMLSLVCESLYPKLIGPNADSEIIKAVKNYDLSKDTSVIDDVISTYSKVVFARVSDKTRIFIEERLITNDNKRTMIALSDLRDEDTEAELMNLSGQSELRYLNIVQYFDTKHVEILHDRLLKPVIVSREERRKEEEERRIKKEIEEREKELREELEKEEKKLQLKIDEENRKIDEVKRKVKIRNRRILIGLTMLTVTALALIYIFAYNPKNINDFAVDETSFQIEELGNHIKQNSIVSLINIFKYRALIEKIGFSNVITKNYFDPLSSLKKDLTEAITNTFSNEQYFYSYSNLDYGEFTVSPKCAFKCRLDPSGQYLEMYKLVSRNEKSYDSIGSIKFTSLDENYNPKNGTYPASSIIKYLFSPNDSFFCIQVRDRVFLYGLNDKIDSINSYILNDINSETRFSIDSKLLIFLRFWGDAIIDSTDGIVKSKRADSTRISYWKLEKDSIPQLLKILPIENKFEDAFIVRNGIINYFISSNFKKNGSLYSFNFLNRNSDPNRSVYTLYGNYLKNIGDTLFVSFSDNTIKYYNVISKAEGKIKTDMELPIYCNYSKSNNKLILFDNKGNIEFHDLSNIDSLDSRKIQIDTSEISGYDINSFVSPSEDKIIFVYSDNLILYEINNNSVIADFKSYDRKIQNCIFNSDSTISLIDNNGVLLKWHYTKKPTDKINELENYYNEFSLIYKE